MKKSKRATIFLIFFSWQSVINCEIVDLNGQRKQERGGGGGQFLYLFNI